MDADLERRFGGLKRLYGASGYERLRALRVAVVGVGGVGSWAVEALARCGVSALILIDLDQVSESNINRQIQAVGATVGKAKVTALAERIADIHPGCRVVQIEEFVEPGERPRHADPEVLLASAERRALGNWPALLPELVDVLIDACDQVKAKATLAAWALKERVPLVCCGAAGGKQQPHRLEVDDLAQVTHDPLLASLRQRLRKDHGASRTGKIGVRCVFSRESVRAPDGADACDVDGSLNCHGYGSSVMVTASMGLAAAAEAVALALAQRRAEKVMGTDGAARAQR
jgi:tRNA threonylcarbamoyladenosine dehydratase